jgi:RND family efflux transporter MFP subunit
MGLVISLFAATGQGWAAGNTELDCILEPEMTVELSSPVDGIVKTVAVDKSDRVQEGEVLATLEAGVEEAIVELARMRATMDEEIEARKIERDLAVRKNQRVVKLYKQKSVPQFEKDEAEAAATVAQLDLERAQNNRKLAVLELNRAEADLQLRVLRSTVDGVVVERYVHPGESVKDRPLLKLAKIDPLKVEIIAPSALFGQITPGMNAEIIVDGPLQARHQAQVSVVDSVVDAASDTFGIRLTLPNPDNKVVGGLKCRAVFGPLE